MILLKRVEMGLALETSSSLRSGSHSDASVMDRSQRLQTSTLVSCVFPANVLVSFFFGLCFLLSCAACSLDDLPAEGQIAAK